MLKRVVEQKINFEILLHDIRSVQNVASIFRLADCIGCRKIFLSGITPGPKDRFGRTREDFVKISLGAEENVPWERIGEEIQNENFSETVNVSNLEKCLEFMKNFKGLKIALEQSEMSVDYKKYGDKVRKDVENGIENLYLIVPGREVEGLEESILKKCDVVCEIPQYGKKESLNIFSSMSIFLYRLFDI